MDDIVYFDRYSGKECVEHVYGDRSLRWTYGTVAGKAALHSLVKRAWFSRWYGWQMDRPRTREKIAPFIEEYGLDADEFLRRPDEFANFNEFFYRQLKPAARPIDADPGSIVFPADGRHLCVPDLSKSDGLFVKGEMFDVRTLLAEEKLASEFDGGSLILSRLCPTDYHRFHFPVAGIPGVPRLINGPLFSVNPIALCQSIQILGKNKRCLTVIETEAAGKVLFLEIGATCVGGICQTFVPGEPVAKGGEKGYFRFGGSSTITIFQPDRIRFDDDLVQQSAVHRELYAKVGDHMGKLI